MSLRRWGKNTYSSLLFPAAIIKKRWSAKVWRRGPKPSKSQGLERGRAIKTLERRIGGEMKKERILKKYLYRGMWKRLWRSALWIRKDTSFLVVRFWRHKRVFPKKNWNSNMEGKFETKILRELRGIQIRYNIRMKIWDLLKGWFYQRLLTMDSVRSNALLPGMKSSPKNVLL